MKNESPSLPSLAARKLRSRARILSLKFEDFKNESGYSKGLVPPPSALWAASKLSLDMAHVEFCEGYIAAKCNASLSIKLTIGLLPLPYSSIEFQGLKRGLWYLIKRSHTEVGQYSISSLQIDSDEHESHLGCVWEYHIRKMNRANNFVNSVGGFIGRNYGQYEFIGNEIHSDGAKPWEIRGLHYMTAKMEPNSKSLKGVLSAATHVIGTSAAAKIFLFHVSDEITQIEDYDHNTGIFMRKDFEKKAREIGVTKQQVREIVDHKLSSDWGLLVAD